MEIAKLEQFIDRYVGMWHEPDPAVRRGIVRELFARDAEDVTTKSICRGWDEIEARVARAHTEWVAEKSFVFRATDDVEAHHGLVKLVWAMRPAAGGPAVAYGLDVFVLRTDGLIQSLYQFNAKVPS